MNLNSKIGKPVLLTKEDGSVYRGKLIRVNKQIFVLLHNDKRISVTMKDSVNTL